MKIFEFINEHLLLLNHEVIEFYPDGIKGSIAQKKLHPRYHLWTKELMALSWDELLTLQNSLNPPAHLSDDFAQWIRHIYQFSKTHKLITPTPRHQQANKSMTNQRYRHLSEKKKHEANVIDTLLQKQITSPCCLYDIGGGQGLLSTYLLTNNHHLEIFSLDQNQELQNQGAKRAKRWFPEFIDRLHFISLQINDKNTIEINQRKKSLLLGLHGCGDLSVNTLKNYLHSGAHGLISIPCCFHHLSKALISHHYQHCLFSPLSLNALTLAAKTAQHWSYEDHQDAIAVKRLRYGVDFLFKNLALPPLHSIGNILPKDRTLPFELFLERYLPWQKLEKSFHEKNFNRDDFLLRAQSFWKDPLREQHFLYYYFLGILRSLMARVIERFLIDDRRVYLEENNQKAIIIQLFNENISPRNFAILSVNSL